MTNVTYIAMRYDLVTIMFMNIVTLLFKLCMFPFVNKHINLLIHGSR